MAKPGIKKPKTRAPKTAKAKGIAKPKAAKGVKAYRGKAKKDVFAKGDPKGAKPGLPKKLLGGKGHA